MNNRQTARKHRVKNEIRQFKTDLNKTLKEKFVEAVNAVLPIILLVLLLCFSIAAVSPAVLLEYLFGAVLLVLGMMFFSLGAEMSMTPMGEKVGSSMTRSKKLWVMCVLGFVLGFIITISEPDLQVLAEQVPSVPNMVLILAVAAGVGIFLVLSLLRILFGIPLPPMLVVFYGIVFIMAAFTPKSLTRAVAAKEAFTLPSPHTQSTACPPKRPPLTKRLPQFILSRLWVMRLTIGAASVSMAQMMPSIVKSP